MIHQLDPTLNVYTPLGKGRTLFMIDYGIDMNTIWVVCLNGTNEIKHFDANNIRIEENYTLEDKPLTLPDGWKI